MTIDIQPDAWHHKAFTQGLLAGLWESWADWPRYVLLRQMDAERARRDFNRPQTEGELDRWDRVILHARMTGMTRDQMLAAENRRWKTNLQEDDSVGRKDEIHSWDVEWVERPEPWTRPARPEPSSCNTGVCVFRGCGKPCDRKRDRWMVNQLFRAHGLPLKKADAMDRTPYCDTHFLMLYGVGVDLWDEAETAGDDEWVDDLLGLLEEEGA